MKNLLVCIILPFCLIMISCNANNTYRFSFNGKNYEVVKVKKSWADAAMYASDKSGRLAEIHNAAEQAAIYDAITNGAKISSDYTKVEDGGGIAYVWIGATDKRHEGIWMWDGANNGKGVTFWTGEGAHGKNNGAPVPGAYVDWGGTSNGKPNEPDNSGGNQNAAAIGLDNWPKNDGSLGHAGEWNDINENNQLYFVIQYDK